MQYETIRKKPTLHFEDEAELEWAKLSLDALDNAVKHGQLNEDLGAIDRFERRIRINDMSDQLHRELGLPLRNRLIVVSWVEGVPSQSGPTIQGAARLALLRQGSDLMLADPYNSKYQPISQEFNRLTTPGM